MTSHPKITSASEGAETSAFKGRFIKAMGKRKTAAAQVRLYKKGQGLIMVNGKKAAEALLPDSLTTALQPLKLVKLQRDLNISVLVKGGGQNAQAEAIRNGIAKALIAYDDNLRPGMKAKGWLTRDARKTERKKPGLKKARRAPQWSKR